MRHHHCFSLSKTGGVVTSLMAAVLLSPTAAVAAPIPDVPRLPAIDSNYGNTVVNWSAFIEESGVAACAGPVAESRMMATVHIAVSDALNAIVPDSQPIAYRGQEPAAYARSAVASAARTSLVQVLRTAPGLSADCRQTSIAIVTRAAEASMAALPDRPPVWIGVVLGEASAHAAVSWTAEHPVMSDLAWQRLARADAGSRELSMWETAALLAECSTAGC
jgi:hypothetical protein